MSDINRNKTVPLGSGMAPMAKTREQSITDSMNRIAEFQKLYPDVDFKGAIIEPTINLTFDFQERVNEANQKKHNALITQMFGHTAEPAKAAQFLKEARECLLEYPVVLEQFDNIYNRRPVNELIGQLHEVFEIKRKAKQNIEAETKDAVHSGGVEDDC